MARQEKKAFLNRYRLLDRQVQRTVDELERWRSRAEKIAPNYSEANGESEEDQLQSVEGQIVQLKEQANRQIEELLTVKGEMEQAIATLPDATDRLLLTYRVLDGLTWEQVAQRMNYTERWIYRLYNRALDRLTVPEQSPMVKGVAGDGRPKL